jgi:hypothetical protein
VEHFVDYSPMDIGKNILVVRDMVCAVVGYRITIPFDEGVFKHLTVESECVPAPVIRVCSPLVEIITVCAERQYEKVSATLHTMLEKFHKLLCKTFGLGRAVFCFAI